MKYISKKPVMQNKPPLFHSLKGLADFIEEADKGLSKPLVEGDYEGLLEIMDYLMKVKDRQIETDNMFEPLKDVIELVKTYDMDFPEETYVLLQVIIRGVLSYK